MATTSSSSRNRDSGSRRNAPQRRSMRGHNDSAPLKLTASSQLFRSRDLKVTCFNFPLDPTNFDHLKVICSKCKLVLDQAKDGILTDAIKNKTRTNKRMCERPWELSNKEHRESSKRKAYDDFHELFEEDASAVEEDNDSNPTQPQKKKQRRRTAKNHQNNGTQQRDAQPIIFGEDGHFTDDAAELLQTKLNFTPNDNDLRVVQMLMEWTSTSPAVFDQDGHITNNTVKLFERRLHTSRKDGLNPNDNDLRVTGMLMKWTFDSKDTKQYNAPVAVLPSFPHVKSIIVARVPQLVNSSAEESTRLRNLRRKAFSSWLDCLKMTHFDPDMMIDVSIRKRKTIPKPFLVKELNKYRMSAEETLAAFEYAKINIRQGQRLMQAVDVGTRLPGMLRGVLLFAPTSELYRAKGNYVKLEYPTLTFQDVSLEEVVLSNKKKDVKVTKMKRTSVGSCRGEEAIYSRLTGICRNGLFSPGSERYKVPFHVPEGCDTAGVKWSCDTGNGSFKCCLSALNVKNPQGQEHVVPILEFNDAKDNYDNMKKVFDTHPEVKRCIEDVCHRRVVLLEVKIGDKIGYCMATNVSNCHDRHNPSALPALSAERAKPLQQPQPQYQPVDKYSIRVDFSRVTSTKLMYNENSNLYEGLQFEDADGNCLGTSLFKTPIKGKTIDLEVQLKQIFVFGVFTADLKFLYELFGHQGHAAVWSCLFCFLHKKNARAVFDGDSFSVENRTTEKIFEDAKLYAEMYYSKGKGQQREKPKFRSNITQQYSHSIIREPILNIPLDCVTKASMHVVLGFTNWLVNLSISAYECIEKKAAARSASGTEQVAFRETIELVLKKLYRYKEFLTDQEKDTKSVFTRQSTVVADLLSRTDELEAIKETIGEDFSLTEEATAELREKQQQLEDELKRLEQQLETEATELVNSTKENSNLADYTVVLMEQLTNTNNTILECEEYLKNHGGHSKRKFEEVLKKNGCDRQTYFEAQMVGNHCMNYAEHSEVIYSDMFDEFDPIIVQQDLKEELNNFTLRMKEVVSLWFKIQRVIKSVNKQSEKTIKEFEANVKKLKDLIVKLLVTDVPIAEWKSKLPAFPKSHLLFIGHLLDQLSLWGTLGGFDEQNIESAHAIWNQLMRQMGATRGKELKKKVFTQYYLKSAEFIQSNILRLKEETKRPNKYAPRRPKAEYVEDNDSAIAEGQIDTVEVNDGSLVADINEEIALHPTLMVVDPSTAANDTGDGSVRNGAEETAQVKVLKEDTMVHTCSHCKKRVLGVALRVHMFEAHNVILCAEADPR